MVNSRRCQATRSPIQPFLGSRQEIIADTTAQLPFDFIARPTNGEPDRTSSIVVRCRSSCAGAARATRQSTTRATDPTSISLGGKRIVGGTRPKKSGSISRIPIAMLPHFVLEDAPSKLGRGLQHATRLSRRSAGQSWRGKGRSRRTVCGPIGFEYCVEVCTSSDRRQEPFRAIKYTGNFATKTSTFWQTAYAETLLEPTAHVQSESRH